MRTNKKIINIISAITIVLNMQLAQSELFAKNNADKDIVYKTAQKYWKSKLTGDVIACYQFEEPTYKKKVPLSTYAKQGSIVYKDVKLGEVDIQGSNATVKVQIIYFLPAIGSKGEFTSEFKDRWKKINNNWFHVMDTKPAFMK